MRRGVRPPRPDVDYSLYFEVFGLRKPEREVRFHPTRKWVFDLAWIGDRIALEVNGGIFRAGGGAHQGAGHLRDMEKLNHAQLLGWKVFQFTPREMMNGTAAAFLLDIPELRKEE